VTSQHPSYASLIRPTYRSHVACVSCYLQLASALERVVLPVAQHVSQKWQTIV
jgi:hypothetical protein